MLPYGYEKVQWPQTTQEIVISEKTLSSSATRFALGCMMLSAAVLAAAAAEATQVSAFSTGHFGLSVGMAATMTSCFSIGSMVGKIIFGATDDKFGHMPAFLLGIIMIVLSQIMLIMSKKVAELLLIAVLLAGIAMAVYSALPPLMTSEIFGQKDYNKYWAYIMSAGCIAGAIATPVYGSIFDATGTYTVAFIVIIGLAIVGGLAGGFALKVGNSK